MSRIDFKNVCKRYAPGLPFTINNANLTIERGEFCVFVGPSGCGKSTLLRMVAGLEDITSGDLSIGGKRMNDLPPAKRGVAMVFQSYALYPHMTVAENMAFGLRVMGSDKAAIDTKVKRAAEILQLGPLLERLPKQLSGGQRQRVAIGRAIVKEPDVFLFDEPLSNLDAALRVQTRLEIAKLHHDIGKASMIYVTHDQVEAMTLADKIVLLRAGAAVQEHGSVAQFGSPMELYHRPQNLFVAEFIGSPKMNICPAAWCAPKSPTPSSTSAASRSRWRSTPAARRPVPRCPWASAPNTCWPAKSARAAGAHHAAPDGAPGRHLAALLRVTPEAPLVTLRLEGHAPQSGNDKVTLRLRPSNAPVRRQGQSLPPHREPAHLT